MADSEGTLVGRVLGGRYRLLALVGAGELTAVFLADDLQLRRGVAVKVLRPRLMTDDVFARRFRGEAQTAASLDHPNLESVLDWGQEDVAGQPLAYLVLEPLTGGSLQEMMDRGRRLSPSQALVVGLDICRGLDYAHRRGVQHHDVSPGEVLFGADRRPRLGGVGLARALADRAWSDREHVGRERALYSSPEVARGGHGTDRSDVYSLCLVLVEAITGDVPFAADSVPATLAARQDRLMPVTADLGPLASVLEHAGRPDPAERFTAAEFGRALVQAAERLPRPAPITLVRDDTTPIALAPVPDEGSRRPRPPTRGGRAHSSDMPPPVAGPEMTIRDTPADLPPSPPPASGPASPAAPRRRMRAAAWVLAIVALAAVGIGGALVLRSANEKEALDAVPADLVGAPQDDVTARLAGLGWTTVVERENDASVPEGRVIAVDPAPGTPLTGGSQVILHVSDGPKLATVPDLEGVTLKVAQERVADADLTLDVAHEVFSAAVPAGVIVSFEVVDQPAVLAGDEVAPRSAMAVVVSKGPEPVPVPDVVGLAYAAAAAKITDARLMPVRGQDRFDARVHAGVVVAQGVDSAQAVVPGSTVTLYVSKGPELVVLPVLGGLDFSGVQNALRAAGLEVGHVSGNPVNALAAAIVNGQPVQAGAQFPRGTRVDLVYS